MNNEKNRSVGLILVFMLPLIFLSSGCAFRSNVTVWATKPLLENTTQVILAETDVKLARTALESNLKLLEGVIALNPNDVELLTSAAQAYAGFAMMFLEESNPERAIVMYRRALGYGMRALGEKSAVFLSNSSTFREFLKAIDRLQPSDVPAAYWSGVAWASFINLDKSSTRNVSQLPRAIALMKWVEEQDATFYYSAPLWFFGMYYSSTAALLGGDIDKGKEYFDRALRQDGDVFLYGRLLFAQSYAIQTFDRRLFVDTLNEIISDESVYPSDLNLLNSIAKLRAQSLLENVDEIF